MIFRQAVLVSEDGDIIAIRYIESICAFTPEDTSVDKLKDDITFNIITISGQKHCLSIKSQIRLHKLSGSMSEIYGSILEKWIYLVGAGNNGNSSQ